MGFFTYIIYSHTLDRYYVGHCQDVKQRLFRHNNSSGSSYTKRASDWQLRWSESCETRSEAAQLERLIKKKKSRKYIESLISKDDRTP